MRCRIIILPLGEVHKYLEVKWLLNVPADSTFKNTA